jgi:hypothetical protein
VTATSPSAAAVKPDVIVASGGDNDNNTGDDEDGNDDDNVDDAAVTGVADADTSAFTGDAAGVAITAAVIIDIIAEPRAACDVASATL